ncbi:MAG TPA: nitrilase-related carbon-nitrogen hydrolase, partial [Phototrophicaceae bacterium]|nr:nitrilase-related carbon-nitrogen hydrolase [Phototrophicaceae bacterium]
MTDSLLTAAIIQAAPVYYDLPATMTKAQDLIHQAANQGAKLITFGETWFPGYPIWLDYCRDMGLWDHAPTKAVYERLFRNSLSIDSAEMQQLQTTARQLQIALVI